VEWVPEPHPEDITSRGFDHLIHYVFPASSGWRNNYVTQSEIENEERNTAQLKSVISKLPDPQLLEALWEIFLGQLGIDDEIGMIMPNRVLMDDELLLYSRHGPIPNSSRDSGSHASHVDGFSPSVCCIDWGTVFILSSAL
jgi:hypothetical protein